MPYVKTGEVLAPLEVILTVADDVGRIQRAGEESNRILKRGFYDWYREVEKVGAVFEWTGVRGESLSLPDNNERERALFTVFCAEIVRQGIPLSAEEIELGWTEYLNS